jgi:hypothetical protein
MSDLFNKVDLFWIFILSVIIISGIFSQCETDLETKKAKTCYEQTKDVKCWDLK